MLRERWSRTELKAEQRESAAATADMHPALKGNRQHLGRVAIFMEAAWPKLEVTATKSG